MPKPSCKCDDPIVSVYRVGERRRTYFSCWSCGREWTEEAAVEDLSRVVTVDEIIEVHEQLSGNKTLSELIE